MDGTLLESERLARACFIQACADLGWHDLDMGVYDDCVGSTHEATRQRLLQGFGQNFPVDGLEKRWSEHYHSHINSTPLEIKPGAQALLATLSDAQIPVALATSSFRDTAIIKLTHTNLLSFFAVLVCGGEASQGKPHPAPYQLAVEQLQCEAQQCWAVEDSDNGTLSAHRAGLQVVQIPDELEPSQSVRDLGHPILASMHTLHQHLTTLL